MKPFWTFVLLMAMLVVAAVFILATVLGPPTKRAKIADRFEPNLPQSGGAGGPAPNSVQREGKGNLEFYQSSGSAGDAGSFNSANGGGGTGGTYTRIIESDLEPETRAIMRAMGGRQPTDQEWKMLFPRFESSSSGGYGGSISTALYEQMLAAHRVARAQRQPKATP